MPVARSSRPHLVVVMEDLTQRQSLEAQLLVAQKMEAVGQLAGGVAHDFNNLLTVIGTYSSLMLEACAADDPSREDLGEIFSAAQRAAELTRQLLAFGRRQLLDARQLDLNEVVGGFEKMLRRVISAEISLSIVRADDLGAVLADSGQIEQTLLNLVVNARDAMPQGGRLTIETRNVRTVPDATPGRAMAPDSDSEPVAMVMLRVSDNGIGMDEETAARVFEPFFTTKDPGHGTGLGLSTTYGIVTQSGGFVRVHSRVGEGSAFELYFPRMADAVPQPAPMASPDAADTRGTGDIVVVEDDEHVRKIVVNALAALGYTVFEATNGADALDMVLARDAPPDLLVTDLIMPRLNGRDLVQRLRSRWPEMPVLFTTAYAMDEQTDQAASELPGALLRKPFIPAELAVAVRAALQTSAP